MLEHYLRLAWLSFRRNLVSSSVSVFTLALGLTCFILAGGITLFWGSAESYFENADRTVVISSRWTLADGTASSGVALPLTPSHLGLYLESDIPQLETVARVSLLSETTPVRIEDRALLMRSFAADASFLDIFNLPFLAGDSRTALAAPRSAIITQEAALALFGDTRAVGKVISLYENIDVTITGVLDRIPEPSHIGTSAAAPLRFDLLVSRDVYETRLRAQTGGRDSTELPVDWFGVSYTTYALLPADGSLSAAELRSELSQLVSRRIPQAQRERVNFYFDVVPVESLLGMAVRDSLFPQQSTLSVPVLLLLLGAVVLAIACINFANLATARAVLRAKDAGIRKAVGARPTQIVLQHLLEAAMLTAAALFIAFASLDLLIPVIRSSTGIDMRSLLTAGSAGWGLISLLLLGAGVTLAAGFYPAFVLSRVPVAASLRVGRAHIGSRLLTTVLVGVQFAMAAFLLILLTVVFMQNRNLELSQQEIGGDTLLVIENAPEITGIQHEILRQELMQLPQVGSATSMQALPWANRLRIMLASSPSATMVEQSASVYVVGYDFFDTFGIDLIAGRMFDPERMDDRAATGPGHIGIQNIIVPRTLAENLGFVPASEIVGGEIYLPASVSGETAARPYNVIGVVEDRSFSIADRVGSVTNVYLFTPESRFHVVRLSDTDVPAALEAIDTRWQELVPNVAIGRRFLSEYFNDSYASFSRISQAFTALAVVAWMISTIGLYAMAALISSQRVREIAIRRTLGAGRGQIVFMLLKNFSAPVLMANLVVWPFAYLAARAYLNVFSDPIALTPLPFIVALSMSLLISWAAVGGQAWRAANTAPQELMRCE